MKRLRWTDHAKENLSERETGRHEVEAAISRPDSIAEGHASRKIYEKMYFDKILKTDMLMRVIVEESRTERVIVTFYKTSKFKKYGKGSGK